MAWPACSPRVGMWGDGSSGGRKAPPADTAAASPLRQRLGPPSPRPGRGPAEEKPQGAGLRGRLWLRPPHGTPVRRLGPAGPPPVWLRAEAQGSSVCTHHRAWGARQGQCQVSAPVRPGSRLHQRLRVSPAFAVGSASRPPSPTGPRIFPHRGHHPTSHDSPLAKPSDPCPAQGLLGLRRWLQVHLHPQAPQRGHWGALWLKTGQALGRLGRVGETGLVLAVPGPLEMALGGRDRVSSPRAPGTAGASPTAGGSAPSSLALPLRAPLLPSPAPLACLPAGRCPYSAPQCPRPPCVSWTSLGMQKPLTATPGGEAQSGPGRGRLQVA